MPPKFDVLKLGSDYYVVDVINNRVVSRGMGRHGAVAEMRQKLAMDKQIESSENEQVRDLLDQVTNPVPGDINYSGPIVITRSEQHAVQGNKDGRKI